MGTLAANVFDPGPALAVVLIALAFKGLVRLLKRGAVALASRNKSAPGLGGK